MRFFVLLLTLIVVSCSDHSGSFSSPEHRPQSPTESKHPMPPAAVGVGHGGNLWTSERIPLTGVWQQGGYWDRDLGLLDAYQDGEPILAPLPPQEGVVPLTPLNAPIMREVGIGSRRSILLIPNGGLSPCLTADALGSLVAGVNKPVSVMMRIQRLVASGVTLWGFSNGNATNDFEEGFLAAAGNPLARKRPNGGPTVTATGSVNLQFTSHVLAWVTDGLNLWIYVDGVLDPAFPPGGQPFTTAAIASNQFTFGTQRRAAIAASLNGLISHMAVTPIPLTGAQVAQVSAKWLLGDAPVLPGEFVYVGPGDSLTMGSMSTNTNGFRKALWEHIVANSYNANLVGAKFNGNFPDNEHSGYSGFNLSNLTGIANSQLGPGGAFAASKIALTFAGTNNMGVGATPFNNPGTMNEYAAYLDTIANLIPTLGMTVTKIPAINPALYPGPSANVNTFNAALAAIWAAFQIAHPGITLRTWDANAALGGPVYNPAFYAADGVHMNDAGYAQLAAALIVAADPLLAAL